MITEERLLEYAEIKFTNEEWDSLCKFPALGLPDCCIHMRRLQGDVRAIRLSGLDGVNARHLVKHYREAILLHDLSMFATFQRLLTQASNLLQGLKEYHSYGVEPVRGLAYYDGWYD